MTKEAISGRINWIDWAKAITIILVVMGHFNFNQSSFTYQNFIYIFHMPIFFFLSGYLYKSIPEFPVFFKKNVLSLIVPYLFFNILTLICITLPYLLLGKITITDLEASFLSFLTGGSFTFAGPTWFLISLFNVKLISYFILKLKIKYQILLIIIFPIIALLIKGNLYYGLKAAFVCIPFYIVGFHVRNNNLLDKIKDSRYLQLFLFLISFVFLVVSNNIQGRIDVYKCVLGTYPLLFYVNAFVGSFMVIMFCKMLNNLESKFVKTISSGTIVILGLHIFLNIYISKIVSKLGHMIYTDFSLNLFVIILMSITVVLILYYPILFLQKYFPFFIGNRK